MPRLWVDCGSDRQNGRKALCREKKATNPARGPVAQWSEPAAHNRLVGGSSPSGPTIPYPPAGLCFHCRPYGRTAIFPNRLGAALGQTCHIASAAHSVSQVRSQDQAVAKPAIGNHAPRYREEVGTYAKGSAKHSTNRRRREHRHRAARLLRSWTRRPTGLGLVPAKTGSWSSERSGWQRPGGVEVGKDYEHLIGKALPLSPVPNLHLVRGTLPEEFAQRSRNRSRRSSFRKFSHLH